MQTRRSFIGGAAALAGLAGCRGFGVKVAGDYSVSVLGDTHFDAEPESVYHSHYDESNRWAKVQHEEFRRNGEMWRDRCRKLLAASAKLAHEKGSDFVLQLGDIIQGDCDDVPTHKKMLDDCIKMLRTPYPQGIPFLTVMGNHDFRGKGAREAYLQFAEPFISREAGCIAKYPVFSFRRGPDLWVFCDFETKDIGAICACIEAAPSVRYTFLVTHGPFTCPDGEGSFRWRLAGRPDCAAGRVRLYELLSRRHAIVLSGHTHTIAYYRHENSFGGFSEFTGNSVWKAPEIATAEPICDDATKYATLYLAGMDVKKRADYEKDAALFRPGVKDYFFNRGAGHFRLVVSANGVEMEFYPGAALVPARTFKLK